MTAMFEVVNIKDGSRLSRPSGKTSTTLFDSEAEASQWMAKVGLSLTEYAVRPAKEKV